MLKRGRVVTLLFAAAATAALSLTSAPASHADISTGYIMNGANQLCVMTPPSSNPEGVQLQQLPCSFGGSLWSLMPLGNGTWNIVNTATHLCLRARANADFSPVDGFGCTGVSNDAWVLSRVIGGPAANLWQIKSEISTGGEPCLDVQNDSPYPGAPIDVFHCGKNNLAQMFFIP
jgi:hypothetical protein